MIKILRNLQCEPHEIWANRLQASVTPTKPYIINYNVRIAKLLVLAIPLNNSNVSARVV